MSTGQFIQSVRSSLGMSGATLAHRMGEAGFEWAQQTVSQVECGKRKLTLDEGYSVANILGVSLEDLVTESATERVKAAARRRLQMARAELDASAREFEDAQRALSDFSPRKRTASFK